MAAEKETPSRDNFSDPNYAIICSFFDQFAQLCGINHHTFAELQEMLENTVEVPQPIVELHIKLLRKVRKSCPPDKWEKTLIKFAHTYSKQDGWELERFGYKNATVEVKLRLLKQLLEAQFDLNVKFKAEVNKLVGSKLRLEPLGKDQNGFTYWCQFDPSSHIRIYKEDPDEDDSWDLIAKDRDGLVNLIDSLCSGEGQRELSLILNEDSTNSGEIEKPITDTGQVPEESPMSDEDSNKHTESPPSEIIEGALQVEPVNENKVEQVVHSTNDDPKKKDEITPEVQPEIEEPVKEKEEPVKEKEEPVKEKEISVSEELLTDELKKEDSLSEKSPSPLNLSEKCVPAVESTSAPAKIVAPVRKPGSRLDEIFRVKGLLPEDRLSIESKDSLLAQMSESFNRDTEIKRLIESPPKENPKRTKLEKIEQKKEVSGPKLEKSPIPVSKVSDDIPQCLKKVKDNNTSETLDLSASLKNVPKSIPSVIQDSSEDPPVSDDDSTILSDDNMVVAPEDGEQGHVSKLTIAQRNISDDIDSADEALLEEEEIDEEEDEVGSEIEEPMMLVTGEGSGADCDAVNPRFAEESSAISETIEVPPLLDFAPSDDCITNNRDSVDYSFEGIGEAIEEPLMIITGEGWGTDCDTGNIGQEGTVAEKPVKSENYKADTNGDHIEENSSSVDSNEIKSEPVKIVTKEVSPDKTTVNNNPDSSTLRNGVNKFEKSSDSDNPKNGESEVSKDSKTQIPVFNNVKTLSEESNNLEEEDKPVNSIYVKEESIEEMLISNKDDGTSEDVLENVSIKKEESEVEKVEEEEREDNQPCTSPKEKRKASESKKVVNSKKTNSKKGKRAQKRGGGSKTKKSIKENDKPIEEEHDEEIDGKACVGSKDKKDVKEKDKPVEEEDKEINNKASGESKTKRKEKDKPVEEGDKVIDNKASGGSKENVNEEDKPIGEDEKEIESKASGESKSENNVSEKDKSVEEGDNKEIDEKEEQLEQESSRRRSTRSGGRIPPPLITPKRTPSKKNASTKSVEDKKKEKLSSPAKQELSLTSFSLEVEEEPPPPTGKKRKNSKGNSEGIAAEPITATKKQKTSAKSRSRKSASKKTAENITPSDEVVTPKKKEPARKTARSSVVQAKSKETEVKPKPEKAKDKSNESAAKGNKVVENSEDKSVKKATKPRTKRGTVLGLLPSDLASVDDVGRGVRQSRRIAQIKIKEQQDERKAIDHVIESTRPKSKKDRDPQYKAHLKGSDKKKKKKKSGDVPSDEEEAPQLEDQDGKKKKKRGRKKKKNRFSYDISHPWKSSSDDSSMEGEEDEEDHLDIYEDDEDLRAKPLASDHEFSPESDLEKEEGETEAIKRARTARKGEDVEGDDTACRKCSKSDHPEWILLCDKCDSGWHASCLRPALMVIPEGDWFCPPCQHAALVSKLKETLRLFERDSKRRDNDELRRKRLAYVGISLSNVLPVRGEGRKNRVESSSTRGSSRSESSESESSSSSSEDEPVYQLRARRSQVQSYSFNDYDQLINSAIQEEYGDDLPPPPPPKHVSIGKDIGTIERVNRAAEEAEAAGLNPDGEVKEDDEEEGGEGWKPRVVPKHVNISIRKRQRKLNNLDASSADDDANDSDFKGSSFEEEEDDGSGSDSDRYVAEPVRRSGRARQSRIDREFINDSTDSDSDAPKKKKNRRRAWSESESDSSDASWGRRKKRKAVGGGGSRRKKPLRKFYDSDSEDKPKRPKAKRARIKFGGLDDGEVLTSRTRGKKMSYQETDDDIESEEEVPSKAGRHKKVIESDTAEEDFGMDEQSDEEKDVEEDSNSGSEGDNVKKNGDEKEKEAKEGKVKNKEKLIDGDENTKPVKAVDKSEESLKVEEKKVEVTQSSDQSATLVTPSSVKPATVSAPPDSTNKPEAAEMSPESKDPLSDHASDITSDNESIPDGSSDEGTSDKSEESSPVSTPTLKIPTRPEIPAVPPGIPLATARMPHNLGTPRNFMPYGMPARITGGHGPIPFRPSPSFRARMAAEAARVTKTLNPAEGSILTKVLSSNLGSSVNISTVSPTKGSNPSGPPVGKGIAALAAMLRANSTPSKAVTISPASSEAAPTSASGPPAAASTPTSSTPAAVPLAGGNTPRLPPSGAQITPAMGQLPAAPAAVPVPVAKTRSPSPSSSPTPNSTTTPPTTPSKMLVGDATKLEMLTSAVSITKVSTAAAAAESPTKGPEPRPKGPAIRVVPQQKLMATPPAQPPQPQQFPAFRGARPPFPPRPRYDYPPQYPFYHYAPPPPPVEEFTYVPTSPPPPGYDGPPRAGYEGSGRPPPASYDVPPRSQPANFEGPARPPGFEPPARPPGFEPPARPPGFEPPARPPGFEPPARPPGFEGQPRPNQSHEGEFSGLVSYFSSQHDDSMES